MTGTVRLPLLIINSKSVPEFRIRLTESRWLLLTKSSYFFKNFVLCNINYVWKVFSTLTGLDVFLRELLLTYTLTIYRFNDITNLNKIWFVSWTVLYKSENIQWQIIFLKEWLFSSFLMSTEVSTLFLLGKERRILFLSPATSKNKAPTLVILPFHLLYRIQTHSPVFELISLSISRLEVFSL